MGPKYVNAYRCNGLQYWRLTAEWAGIPSGTVVLPVFCDATTWTVRVKPSNEMVTGPCC